jgi:hypothetical protein
MIGLVIMVILILIFATNENSLVFIVFNQYSPVDWEEVFERNIVRSSIPIEVISKEQNDCIILAKNLDKIINHQYFIRSSELVEELKYDFDNETLYLPCELLEGDRSRLNIWFVVEESEKHSAKYEYFITPWENTIKNSDISIISSEVSSFKKGNSSALDLEP